MQSDFFIRINDNFRYMFNPFYPFTKQLLEAFVRSGKNYFVRQTFSRAKDHFDEGIKGYYSFSHYDNITTAQKHYKAIGHDPNRFLYGWDDPEHQEKLKLAASGLKEYKIFSAVFKPDWEKGITNRMKDKIKLYVDSLGWKPKSGESVAITFEIKFGVLFIKLKHRIKETEVNFEKIENLF